MVGTEAAKLVVAPVQAADTATWSEFVREANDGTLYHDLAFLAYHPPGRHRFAHLTVRSADTLVAVVPGALVECDGGTTFVSTAGASVGGPLVLRPLLNETTAVVEALQEHARAQGWAGLEFVLGPTAYQRQSADVTSFAVFRCGFKLVERDLSFVIPLDPAKRNAYTTLFRKKQAWGVRAAERRGVRVVHGGGELLSAFTTLFRETYDRHGVAATHSEAEIDHLLRRLPDRVQITLATLGDAPVASILVFRLNERAAQVVYICSSKAHAQENGTVAAFAALIERLAADGVVALDLGPSASSHRVNDGVVFFKEGLGAVGQARDHWAWTTQPA